MRYVAEHNLYYFAERFMKKTILQFIKWVVIIFAFPLIYFLYWLIFPTSIYYPSLGIAVPKNYSVHGIDVSHHNGNINWREVADMKTGHVQISFAFLKATQGRYYKDWTYIINSKRAKNAGIIKGAYHYFEPGVDPEKQAKNFINYAKLKSGDFPPVLDVEENNGMSKSALREKVRKILTLWEKEYQTKPILYCNADYYQKFFNDGFEQYPVWVAHYYTRKPRIHPTRWTFWQHNDGGNVNGIETKTDYNVFNGSLQELREICLD